MTAQLPPAAVFVGELVCDLVVRQTDLVPRAERIRRFSRVQLPAEEWLRQLRKRIGDGPAEVLPGGSIANVAAAFADSLPPGRPDVTFSCTGQPPRGRVTWPLWWPGHSSSAADLASRSIRVVGHDVADRAPETPGTIAVVDARGTVVELTVNAPLAATLEPVPAELLVLRSDHLALLDESYVRAFDRIAVVLSDFDIDPRPIGALADGARQVWIFGPVDAIYRLRDRVGNELELIGTDGSRACHILSADDDLILDVDPMDLVVSDLGAGDAYAGGYLGAASAGGSRLDAHAAGCHAARRALICLGARPSVDPDLNRLLPLDKGRQSQRADDGRLFQTVRRSPGVTILSGGQTGVDSLGAQAALGSGLPVHLIFPRGLRQEDGPLTIARRELLAGGRVHELGSASFRFRTWACVYLCDAVVLLDYACGEGSQEARVAARQLNRPVLECGDRDVSVDDVAAFLSTSYCRVLLIAGNRASLLSAHGQDEQARSQLQTVARAVELTNARRMSGGDLPGLPAHVRRIGVPPRLRETATVTRIIDAARRLTVVPLPPRDVARALERGALDAGFTWPGLIAPDLRNLLVTHPLGSFPVHYGFALSDSASRRLGRCVDQYPTAGPESWEDLGLTDHIDIEGMAEEWLRHGMADSAFDTYRTGRTLADYDLHAFFPIHWETLSLVVVGPSLRQADRP